MRQESKKLNREIAKKEEEMNMDLSTSHLSMSQTANYTAVTRKLDTVLSKMTIIKNAVDIKSKLVNCPKCLMARFKALICSGGHLGHVTSIMSSDFHFLVPESFLTKFG